MIAADALSPLREKPFSEAIEKLEELLTQSGRAFLLGAGCSKCAGLPLTAELTENALKSKRLNDVTKSILSSVQGLFSGSPDAHIEDYLSELIDLLAIADRREARRAMTTKIKIGSDEHSIAQLRAAIDQIKNAIAELVEQKLSIETHRAFVAAVHRPLRVGRAVPGQVVDYLVLNYDSSIEDALALERLPYADGLDGGVTGWWNPGTFDRADLAARVFKLHGSVNWCEFPGDPLPRRIAPHLDTAGAKDSRIVIWPATTKYRETQLDPFAQLADRARRVLRPAPGSQRVVVVCGYGFGDAHVNIEIERALHASAGDLTLVAFTSDDEPAGQLKNWTEEEAIRDQVLAFANRSFVHGHRKEVSTHDLPWWRFEIMTRLLEGER